MDESEPDFRSIICLVRRRLHLIALTFAVVTVLAGLATLLMVPNYTASALIFIDTAHASLLDPEGSRIERALDHAQVDSEVEILRSDTVLLEAIAALDLAGDPEFGAQSMWTAALPPQEALARLKGATTIQRQGLTYLISVTVRAKDPDRAAQIANTIADTYLALQLRGKVDALAATGEAIAAGIAQAREDMIEADRRIAAHPGSGFSAPGFELVQSAERARSHYRTLLARNGDLSVEARLQIPHSRIISRAVVPGRPSSPGPGLILALAAACGLGLGIVLAFARERLAGGFTSGNQLARMTRKPSLGDVPFESFGGGNGSVAALMVEAPLSPFAESIRRVRAGIDGHLDQPNAIAGPRETQGRIIMVSSSIVDEGKTALSLSLARAYAASGKKTLLIDCDLHRPSIHRHLDIRPEIGLVEYLAGRDSVKSFAPMIVLDADTGLTILVGSHASDEPTDRLIASPHFGRLINAAVGNFDVVILDSPPLLPVADGLHLARYADIILFVVRWSSTAQALVRDAIGQLETTRLRPPQILTVLNGQGDAPQAYERRYGTYARG